MYTFYVTKNLRIIALEKYKEIERSIITTYRARLWSKFTKAIRDYELIEENDNICVCISGGKDSMVMAKLFQELKRHSKVNFNVKYLVMNPGYNELNLNVIKGNLELLNVPAQIVESNIFEVANAQDKNPCYLCARMRRGTLYKIAKSLGCNKIALGHHYDDVIETTLMNMLNAGSFQTMLPKLHSDNFEGMELIRPLYLIREKDIITWANSCGLKFIQCACAFTANLAKNNNDSVNSQRYQTKKLIENLISYNENVEKNIFKSASNVNLDKILGYKSHGKTISYLDDYKNFKPKNKE